MPPYNNPPTENQIDLFVDLAYERLAYSFGADAETRQQYARDMIDSGQVTKTSISELIGMLKGTFIDLAVPQEVRTQREKERFARMDARRNAQPQTPSLPQNNSPQPKHPLLQQKTALRQLANTVLTKGRFYVIKDDPSGDGHIYSVRQTRSQNRNLYALRLDKANKKWDYGVPGGIYTEHLVENIGKSEFLTVQTAAQVGLNLNWCIVCGRKLGEGEGMSSELSAKVGIGPVCIKNLGSHMTQQDLYNEMLRTGAIQP